MPGFTNKYPYTDFHELNLDWIIETVKELAEDWAATLTEWHNTEEEWTALHDYVMNYFANLDLQEEVNIKLNEMVADGTLDAIILPILNEYEAGIDGRIETLESRVTEIATLPAGSTSGDAELIDIRTPATGFHGNVAYANAGDAVRGQITELFGRIVRPLGSYSSGSLDDLERNTVVIAYGSVTNLPETGFVGVVVTLSGNTGSGGQNIAQLALGRTNTFIRYKYSSWESWKRLNNNLTSYYPATGMDMNDLTPISVATAYGNTHQPTVTTNFGGVVLTFAGSENATQNIFQIASDCQYDRVFVRNKYAAWKDWQEVSIGNYNDMAFRALKNTCVCGDSLSVSISYNSDTSDLANVKSWLKYLADESDGTGTVYAQGGITTGQFLASTLYTNAVAHTGDAAFVFLGTNDGNNGVSRSTFKTNYQAIVNGLLTNHKVVFCISLTAALSSNGIQYNEDMQDICNNTSGAFYCDITRFSDKLIRYRKSGHLCSFGYSALANYIEISVNEVIGNNDYFKDTFDFT